MCCRFVAKSSQFMDILEVVEKIASTNSPVFIHGENGVGKGLIAEQIHLKSLRRNESFVRVNCFSNSYQLLENETFRQENSASGKVEKSSLELASKGTLFFEEIGELPLSLQQRLLETMQLNKNDIRFIASSSDDLELMVQNGSFLSELYYRFTAFSLHIPSLRDRKDDIEPLAMAFLEEFSKKTKKKFTGFTQNALEMLYDYYWLGNVRELKNAIEKACILGQPPIIQSFDLRLNISNADDMYNSEDIKSEDDRTLKTALHKFKKSFVMQTLDSVSWNQTEAAKIMGIQRTYLSKLMSDLDIRK